MQHSMFIVRHNDTYHGPFLDFEAEHFCAAREGNPEIIPLIVPVPVGEYRGPTRVQILDDDAYCAHVDSFKVDTQRTLAGVIQTIWFARRDERVLTAREMLDIWRQLFRVSRAVESLMSHARLVIERAGTGAAVDAEGLASLRKAFWRNRDSEDMDAHYEHRFW